MTTHGTNTHARHSQPHRYATWNVPLDLVEPYRLFPWNDSTWNHASQHHEPPINRESHDSSYDIAHRHQPAPNVRPHGNGQ